MPWTDEQKKWYNDNISRKKDSQIDESDPFTDPAYQQQWLKDNGLYKEPEPVKETSFLKDYVQEPLAKVSNALFSLPGGAPTFTEKDSEPTIMESDDKTLDALKYGTGLKNLGKKIGSDLGSSTLRSLKYTTPLGGLSNLYNPDILNKPIGYLDEFSKEAVEQSPGIEKPVVPLYEPIRGLVNKYTNIGNETTGDKIIRGVGKAGVRFAEGLETPENLAYLTGLGPVSKLGAAGNVASGIATAGFLPKMAEGIAAGGKQAYYGIQEGDPGQIAEGVTNTALSTGMTYGIGKSLLNGMYLAPKDKIAIEQDSNLTGPINAPPPEPSLPIQQPLRETPPLTEPTRDPLLLQNANKVIEPALENSITPENPLMPLDKNIEYGNILKNQSGIATIDSINNFAKEDIVPRIESATKALSNAFSDINKVIRPAEMTDTEFAKGSLRQHLSEKSRSMDILASSLSEAKKAFDSLPENVNYDFIDRMETGKSQPTEQLQSFADKIRTHLDEKRNEIVSLGTGKLENFIENYFPHYYKEYFKDPSSIRKIFSKRPLEGSKSFLKTRTFETLKDATDYGLTPVSKNPVDYVLFKSAEMDKYIMATKTLQELQKTGDVVAAKDVSKNSDLVPIMKFNEYYAPENVARLFNNYLSPGLSSTSSIFKTYMNMSNILNQFQLGVSAFHATAETLNSTISQFALGIKDASEGNIKKSFKNIITSPAAVFKNYIEGNKLLKEWMKPGSQGEEMGKFVDAYSKGGGRAEMDKMYQTSITDNMMKAFRNSNPLGGISRLPFAAIEQISKPIMENFVPRLKAGAFLEIARHEFENRPNMTTAEMRDVMGKAVDSIDNRFGQMIYDNLFWNKMTKDLSMASVRSVGWNLGTIRELGGGLADIGKQGIGLLKGKKPEITNRIAYAVALPIVTGSIGAILQYSLTGGSPQETKDYFFPKTGNLDENGNPERFSLPSYMKDVYSYYKSPIKTLSHKVNPLLSMVSEMLQNQDYYGTQIYNQDDPLLQKGKDLISFIGQQFVPFGVQGLLKEKNLGSPTSKSLLPLIGITPAPKSINQTEAEELASEYLTKKIPNTPRTKENFKKSQIKKDLKRELKVDPEKFNQDLELNKKSLSRKEISSILKSKNVSPLQSSVKMLSIQEAMNVYIKANDNEKKTLKKILDTKMQNYKNNHSSDQVKIVNDKFINLMKKGK